MTSIARSAVQLNQDGAQALVQGDLLSALASFRSALQTKVAHQQPLTSDLVEAKPVAFNDRLGVGISQLRMSTTVTENSATFAEDGLFIYEHPLVFDAAILPDSKDGMAVFCGGVAFNMAILFHKKSLLEESAAFHIKALQLYETSINLFSKVSGRYDLSAGISAAVNNKACIYFTIQDYENCTDELAKLPVYMARAESNLTTPTIMNPLDFQGILLNHLLLKPPHAAQAA